MNGMNNINRKTVNNQINPEQLKNYKHNIRTSIYRLYANRYKDSNIK